MDGYGAFAKYYDRLTADVQYVRYLAFIRRIFGKYGVNPTTVLDLACGTGSLSVLLSKAGYDVVAADASMDMLSVAHEKFLQLSDPKPLLLCQDMCDLDLYDTVDFCVCALDSINHITTHDQLCRAFARIALFLNAGGLFVFDINTEYKLRGLDGQTFFREADGIVNIWRNAWDEAGRCCWFYLDFFEQRGDIYLRERETIAEYAWRSEELEQALSAAGLELLTITGEFTLRNPSEKESRAFYIAKKR